MVCYGMVWYGMVRYGMVWYGDWPSNPRLSYFRRHMVKFESMYGVILLKVTTDTWRAHGKI